MQISEQTEAALVYELVVRMKTDQRMNRGYQATSEGREGRATVETRHTAHYGKRGGLRQSILKNLAEKQEQVDKENQTNRNQSRSNQNSRGGPEL